MHNGLKLLTGLAATVVLARGAMMLQGYTMLGRIAWTAQQTLLDAGVTDASLSFKPSGPHATRHLIISGTADPATRRAVIARLEDHPLVIDARWETR